MAARLLVVTGPPGAGKSALARALVDRFDPGVLVEGDAFFGFLRRGLVPPWRPGAESQNVTVIEAAAAAAGRYASGGFSVVYDGVVGPWFLPRFAAAAGVDRLDYVVLLPSVERCVARVAGRKGHGFTDEAATRHMHEQFSMAVLDKRHVVIDPPDDVGAVAELVLSALASGRLGFVSS